MKSQYASRVISHLIASSMRYEMGAIADTVTYVRNDASLPIPSHQIIPEGGVVLFRARVASSVATQRQNVGVEGKHTSLLVYIDVIVKGDGVGRERCALVVNTNVGEVFTSGDRSFGAEDSTGDIPQPLVQVRGDVFAKGYLQEKVKRNLQDGVPYPLLKVIGRRHAIVI